MYAVAEAQIGSEIDEAHYFKNRERVSAVRELACTPGSQQAEDLVMKLDVLRESRRDAAAAAGYALRPGQERVATFSTGTPVANSLGEMWVMQSYLRPDLLADAGVADVDGWGAVFTGTTSGVEMNASGSRLAPVTRVGRFVNVPELVTMSSVYTDVVTRADITVALPELVGGARQVISKPASQEVRDFISDLAYRSEHFDPGRPDIDNSLKVANDGRNVSLDERMANLQEPLDGGPHRHGRRRDHAHPHRHRAHHLPRPGRGGVSGAGGLADRVLRPFHPASDRREVLPVRGVARRTGGTGDGGAGDPVHPRLPETGGKGAVVQ